MFSEKLVLRNALHGVITQKIPKLCVTVDKGIIRNN
jgi:hypothetical protein